MFTRLKLYTPHHIPLVLLVAVSQLLSPGSPHRHTLLDQPNYFSCQSVTAYKLGSNITRLFMTVGPPYWVEVLTKGGREIIWTTLPDKQVGYFCLPGLIPVGRYIPITPELYQVGSEKGT